LVTKLGSKLETKLVANISYLCFSYLWLLDSKLVTNWISD